MIRISHSKLFEHDIFSTVNAFFHTHFIEMGGQFYTGERDGASINLTLEWLF
jgi:hypothetical protein